MKTLYSVLLASLLFAFGAVQAEEGGLRYTIAVAKFENSSQFPSGQFALPSTFASMLTDSLQKTGRFIVLGEKDMRLEAVAEQDFGASGRTAAGNKRPEIGQMTPAQLLVKGEITNFQSATSSREGSISFKGFSFGGGSDQAEINAVIYVVDSSTGQVVASQKILGKATNSKATVRFANRDWGADLADFKNTNVGLAMEQAIDQGVDFITRQLAKVQWEGSVITLKDDNRIYINRGMREGVVAGQRFAIGDIEKIRDPNTGEILDVTVTRVGSVVVEQVKDKLSIARVTEGGEHVRVGMTVTQLHPQQETKIPAIAFNKE